MHIVVGVNAGSAARSALCWAYGFAQRHDADLEVVTAYRPVLATAAPGGPVVVEPELLEESARATQERVVHEELALDALDPRISRVVVPGDPTSALVERAWNAHLLVVGRRAGRLHRMLRGSTSTRCANHASCPVVIIRTPARMSSPPALATLLAPENELPAVGERRPATTERRHRR